MMERVEEEGRWEMGILCRQGLEWSGSRLAAWNERWTALAAVVLDDEFRESLVLLTL